MTAGVVLIVIPFICAIFSIFSSALSLPGCFSEGDLHCAGHIGTIAEAEETHVLYNHTRLALNTNPFYAATSLLTRFSCSALRLCDDATGFTAGRTSTTTLAIVRDVIMVISPFL